jgi:hypothetical protein
MGERNLARWIVVRSVSGWTIPLRDRHADEVWTACAAAFWSLSSSVIDGA